MTAADEEYDAVIAGAGVNGALIAKHLTRAGFRVLLLEAGPGTAWSLDGHSRHLDHFYAAASKGPESPWPAAIGAPQPDPADIRGGAGYFVQNGPDKYGGRYPCTPGGSTLHWPGACLRMLPEDFELRSRFGVGHDWPLRYADLEPYYRRAEHEIGVAADVADQAHHGIEFPEGYDYPMRRIPLSFSDQVLADTIDGMRVTLGSQSIPLQVRSYPAGRNSVPRGGYQPVGAVDADVGRHGMITHLGKRCAGHASGAPVCPTGAKYNAGKTLAQADRAKLRLLAQAVVSTVGVDPVSGMVEGIEYQRYADPGSPRHSVHTARGRVYVLAAHAVENARVLLASGLGGSGSLTGKGLIDHPALYAWGLSPVPVGAYRGPLSTAGIEDLRGGAFRARHAAFRFDIGNDGWRATTGAPDSSVIEAVSKQGLYGTRLRAHLAATLPRHVRFCIAVEQLRSEANAVTIDPRYRDALGNPRPVISYHIDDYTMAGMSAAAAVARQVFRQAGITDCSDPEAGAWFPSVSRDGEVLHYDGMGHFAGTHVMGRRPGESVVDAHQRSWEHRNLYVVGSGSFPTMGTSDPTLTMAALALRTAEHMTEALARRQPIRQEEPSGI
jgi:choline dehydrogenase-like flavoprotein